MAMPQDAYPLERVAELSTEGRAAPRVDRPTWGDLIARSFTLLLCLLHAWAIWDGMGGKDGIGGDWPVLLADHGFHYHHGVVTREFLRETGMSAGYDPSFMSGFPMSVVTGTSSTLSNLAILTFGQDRPALAFKSYTFLAVAALPWLIAVASAGFGAGPRGVVLGVVLYLVYFWTAFPVAYAEFGMTSYLLSVPVGLCAVAMVTRFLDRGGPARWFVAAIACALVFLVHLTSAMVVGPACLVACVVASLKTRWEGQGWPIGRLLGLAAIAPVVVLVNAFWLWPGYWLRSTAGASDFVFAHPESVLGRIAEIAWSEAPVEAIALGLSLLGIASLARREAIGSGGLAGLIAAGLAWGYLAGAFRSLDALQPGRHTYMGFSAACVAGGIGLDEALRRMAKGRGGRLDHLALVALALIGMRLFGPAVASSVRGRIGGPEPFLSSRPPARLLHIIELVKTHLKPGERLLYEETGFGVDGLGDPFAGRHYSPILPTATGVEVLGGPYLHTPVVTNFTQFGENKLFGRKNWDRDFFVRYARLYRPSAILCWSPKARSFCRAHPELIRVVEDDGVILFGRVIGFEGAAIRGSATVEAGPNRLVVRDAKAGDDPSGLVVLRYHFVPFLKADPPSTIEPVSLEDDPVPFIGLRPTAGPVTLRMALPSLFRPGR